MKPGWQADGSYRESFGDRFGDPTSFLAINMDKAGLTMTECSCPVEGEDFTWAYEQGLLFVRWYPQNEGARLWLMLNAPS